MLTSGWGWRRSKATKTTRIARPVATSPSVRPEAQPQSFAREIAMRSAASPAVRMIPPTTSTRPGERTGDSGTKRIVVTVAIAPIAAASQKIQ
jgi:hypothetical protein